MKNALDRFILPVIVSVVAGGLTAWGASAVVVERRLTTLEVTVRTISEDVKTIKSVVFDILISQKEDQ